MDISLEYLLIVQDLIDLCERILDFSEHGDYSNEIEAFGGDEGRVRAQECIIRFRKEIEGFKKRL